MIVYPVSFIKAAGGGFDPDAQAFITAAGLTNPVQQNAINTLVLSLKSNSLWSKLLIFYPFVGATSTSCSYNLINTATYQMTWTGSVNYTAAGIQSSSGGYGNTGWAPSSTLSIWQKGSYGFYLQNDFTIALYDSPMGSVDGSDNRMTAFSIGSGTSLYDWGTSGNLLRYGPGVGFQPGNYVVWTTGAADSITVRTSKNASNIAYTIGTVSVNKAIASTANMTILKRTDGYPWNGTISSSWIGYQISDAESATLAGIINTYQTALSRNTY
jgi:hypothetical protein